MSPAFPDIRVDMNSRGTALPSYVNDTIISPGNINRQGSDTVYCLFDIIPWDFSLYDHQNSYNMRNGGINWINDKAAFIILDAGVYDAFLFAYDANQFYSFVIIREQISLSNNDTLIFLQEEANNLLTYIGVDENNVPFDITDLNTKLVFSVVFPDTLIEMSNNRLLRNNNQVYCSDVSDEYILYASVYHETESIDKIHMAIFEPLNGLTQSHTIKNEPQDYITQDVEFKLPVIQSEIRLTVKSGYKQSYPLGGWGFHVSGSPLLIGPGSFSTRIFHSGYCLDDFGHFYVFHFSDPDNTSLIFSEGFMLENDSLLNSSFFFAPNYVKSPDGGSLSIGNGPVCFREVANHYSGSSQNSIFFNAKPSPVGMFNERLDYAFYSETYKIYDQQWQVLDEGNMIDFFIFTSELDRLRFEVNNKDFTVAGKTGNATRLNFIDFSTEDVIPPNIKSLQIKGTSGFPQEYIHLDDVAKISFTGKDCKKVVSGNYTLYRNKKIVIDSTKLFIRTGEDNEWQEIALNNPYEDEDIGAYFESEELIFDHSNMGYVDVKIYVVDSAGNSTTLIEDPAFRVVDFYVDLEEKQITSADTRIKCYPNPFVDEVRIDYELDKEQDVMLQVCNLQGQTINTIYSGKQSAAKHQMQWNGLSGNNKAEPGIYYLVLKKEGFISSQKLVKLL